ncbi:MAG: hypothetical protein ACSLFK_02135 [Gemmatimonadaceae bacterium]
MSIVIRAIVLASIATSPAPDNPPARNDVTKIDAAPLTAQNRNGSRCGSRRDAVSAPAYDHPYTMVKER